MLSSDFISFSYVFLRLAVGYSVWQHGKKDVQKDVLVPKQCGKEKQ